MTGAARRLTTAPLPKDALFGLEKLADAEGFWTMKTSQRCPVNVGGLATEYVEIKAPKHSRRVETYGGCNKPFEQLYSVLRAAAGLE